MSTAITAGKSTGQTRVDKESTCNRATLALRGRRLEYFTIIWNSLEGLIAVLAGAIAGSISLVGFGVDSFIEHKHWGCRGSLIIDARIKPHHAPVLEMDPTVEKRVDRLFARGGPLDGLG